MARVLSGHPQDDGLLSGRHDVRRSTRPSEPPGSWHIDEESLDISGYTKFLTGTELEHSHAIVTELTKLIRARLVPPMRFVKLEGDAVLCFAGVDAFPDGEQVLELVESCYFDYTSRLLDMKRSTTCECDACRAIGGLGLKFVVHFGTFIVDRDEDGRVDLAGPDVILAHRLLKNTVIESGRPEGLRVLDHAVLCPFFSRDQASRSHRVLRLFRSGDRLRRGSRRNRRPAPRRATGQSHQRRRRLGRDPHLQRAAPGGVAVLRAAGTEGGVVDGRERAGSVPGHRATAHTRSAAMRSVSTSIGVRMSTSHPA